MVISDHTPLIPFYNHPNKLATHQVDVILAGINNLDGATLKCEGWWGIIII